MELDYINIVTHLIAIGIGVAGAFFGLFRSKLTAVKNLVDVVVDAIKDGKVEASEIEAILVAAKKILE